MTGNYKTVKIEAIASELKSLKIEGGWYPLSDKAKPFLKNYLRDDKVRISIEKDTITYIKLIERPDHSKPLEPTKTKELVAKAESKHNSRHIKTEEQYSKEQKDRLFSVSLSYAKDLAVDEHSGWEGCKKLHKEIYDYMKEGKLE